MFGQMRNKDKAVSFLEIVFIGTLYVPYGTLLMTKRLLLMKEHCDHTGLGLSAPSTDVALYVFDN